MTEQSDPYQAPESSLADAVVPYPIVSVGAGRRFLGFVIDYVACIFFIIAFLFFLDYAVTLTSGNEGLDFDPDESPLRDRLLGILFYFTYYIVFEGLFSRTIGKFVTGTIVVDESGYPPSFAQILGRSLARIIPLDPLSFLGSTTRGWHDGLSGTFVVSARRPEPTAVPDTATFEEKVGQSFLNSRRA